MFRVDPLPPIALDTLYDHLPYNKALRARLHGLVQTFATHPAHSFPQLLTSAGYRALGRVLHNPRVHDHTPMDAAIDATCRALHGRARVLVLHDTTAFAFGGEAPRRGTARLNKHNHGFLGHFGLAVAPGPVPQPLGVLAFEALVHADTPRAPGKDWARYHDPAKEFARWQRGIAAARTRCPQGTTLVHVADREADDYAVLCAMTAASDPFVVRMQKDRVLAAPPAGAPPHVRKLREALSQEAAGVCTRTVRLKARATGRAPDARTLHPARDERPATLRFVAHRVRVRRPDHVPTTWPATLDLNVVHVQEVGPPAGETPIEWVLLTHEPIATAAEVLAVVDLYRTRWLIEEFFKALKTGCAYERRQVESLAALLVVLGLFVPIATNMLRLRVCERAAPQAPATCVASVEALEVLRATGRRTLRTDPTVHEVLLAVAALGGHLPHNGPPGWLVLARGMQRWTENLAVWRIARGASPPEARIKSVQS